MYLMWYLIMFYSQVGGSFVSQDCSQTCSCDEAGGELNCRELTCTEHEACVIQGGVRGCYCNEPFQLIDGECLRELRVFFHR